MHNLCRALWQRWSFQQATVVCFEEFASVVDSVGRLNWLRMECPLIVDSHQGVLCDYREGGQGMWG